MTGARQPSVVAADPGVNAAAETVRPSQVPVPVVAVTRDPDLKAAIAALTPLWIANGCADDVPEALDGLRQGEDRAAIVVLDPQCVADPVETLRALREDCGKATAFVVLPVARDAASDAGAPPALDAQVLRQSLRLVGRGTGGAHAAPRAEGSPAAAVSILVADDNRTSRLLLQKVIERFGHRVMAVAGGEAALDALRGDDVDLVVIDAHMPGLDGFEATRRYRAAMDGRRRVPIVGLVEDERLETRALARDAGMDACVALPVDPLLLMDVIGRTLAAHRSPPTPESGAEALSAIAGGNDDAVDRQTLDNLEGLGGRDFLAELVSQFVGDSAQMLEALRAAALAADARRFREVAHALRSSAANVGANRVFQLCLALRQVTAQDLEREGRRYAGQMDDEVGTALSFLEAYVQRPQSSSVEVDDDD